MLDELPAVEHGIERARGLPNRFYISRKLFKAERTAVFFRNWMAIGFAKNVPRPGDAYPTTFMGMPFLIVQDNDARIRVFENVCRHRGMMLVKEPTRIIGVIRCPYHSWCYDLRGKLRTTPNIGGPGINTHEAVDRHELGLVEIRSHIWHDVIFVNVSGTAPDFESYAGALLSRWSEFEQAVHHGGPESSFKLDLKANWKLAVDNYCESYHLPWIHPGLSSYSRIEDHYTIDSAGAFSGQGTSAYTPALHETGREFARFKDLGPKWDSAAEYVALYPNILLGIHKDHFFAIILEPCGTGTTAEHIEIYYADKAMLGDTWDGMRKGNAELWKRVFAEDVAVCEGMQKGRSGEHFDGGRFSPVLEGAVHAFHAWVAGQMPETPPTVEAAR